VQMNLLSDKFLIDCLFEINVCVSFQVQQNSLSCYASLGV